MRSDELRPWDEIQLIHNPNYVNEYLIESVHGHGDSAASNSLPSNAITSGVFGMKLGHKRALSAVEDDVNEPLLENHGKKRKPKKQRCTNEESLKELMDRNPVSKVIKALMDRIGRRHDNDKEGEKSSCIWLMLNLLAYYIPHLYPDLVACLDQIQKQWPTQPDLQNIIKNIQGIKRQAKATGTLKMPATGEVKEKLLKIGEELRRLNEQRREESTKVMKLQEIFITEGVSAEILEEKLSSAYPFLFSAFNGCTDNQDKGRLQTREVPDNLKDLSNELFAEHNNIVDDSFFHQGMENLDNLEPVASRTKHEHGMDTVRKLPHILVQVCAAIKQMEDLRVEELKWDTLLKWGAVINQAKKLTFQVEFAEIQLNKILHAYFAYKTLGSEIRG